MENERERIRQNRGFEQSSFSHNALHLKITEEFEKHGFILFRNYMIEDEELIKITDIFTDSYANDAMRRRKRLGSNKIRDVDIGGHAVPLHSEGSYSKSAWPELIWFFCKKPPYKGGQTTLCDGIELFQKFRPSTKKNHSCDPQFLIKRPDDNKKTIIDRFETYINKTLPILDFYKEQNLLHQIKGIAKNDQIFEEIQGIIASLEA